MFRRNTRVYRLTLAVTVFLFISAVGLFVYFKFVRNEAIADATKLAEDSYIRGRQALEVQDAAAALSSFEQARGLTEKAAQFLDDERKKTKQPTPDKEREWAERQGKLLYLKARILCDTAFASALADGNPITEPEDSFTREKFRSVVQIPAEAARIEAMNCLRQAGVLLPKDLAVQIEVLRLELVYPEPQWNWSNIERVARRVKDLDESNPRARYFLARNDFEQFQEGKYANEQQEMVSGYVATPVSKRSRERVESALEHLQVVKKSPNNPIWRTIFLEMQINRWLVKDGPGSSREKAREYESQYRDVLLNPDWGALPRAGRQEGFATLSSVDYKGLIGLHTAAIELGMEQARASMGSDTKTLFQGLRSLNTLADHLWNNPQTIPYRGDLFETTMQLANKARKVLGSEATDEWGDVRDHLEELGRQAADAHISRPMAYALLAQLLNNEAFLEGKKGNSSAKKDLDARAQKWIDEGLKQARDAKTPLSNLVELYGVAIETVVTRGGTSEDLAPYLDALRKVGNEDRAAAILGVQEAVVLVRQGRLAKAKSLLESVLTNPRLDELRPRALVLLANILLSTQQPAKAIAVLTDIQKAYNRAEEMSPIERAWMMEFLRDPQEIALLMVIAELDTAIQKFDRFQAENPGRPLDQSTLLAMESHENAARQSLKKLTIGKDINLRARIKFATYYLRIGQIAYAVETVKILRADYQNSVEVLRLEVAIDLLPDRNVREDKNAVAQRMKRGDALIQAFMTLNPTDVSAKRFWAEWLIRTNRSSEALEFLKNLKSVGSERDAAMERMLAVALLRTGEVDDGGKVVQQLARDLPNDRSVEILLILTTANPVVRQKLLEDALKTHENNGVLRLLQGEKLHGEGKYADAAKLFWETSEQTRVKAAARMGFLRSAWTLAESDPDAALAMVEQLTQDAPNEAMLYSIAAYAKLKREEFGSAADTWERNKTMCGALRSWEAAARKGGVDPVESTLFRAQFWSMANRTDRAWDELEPLANLRKERVLLQLVDLALNSGDDEKLAKAANFIALLKEARPDSAGYQLLEARLLARMGELSRATELLERLLERVPALIPAYPLLVQLLNDRRQTDKAVYWNQMWLKVAPGDPIATMEVIRQQIVAGRLSDARDGSETFIIEAEDRVRSRLAKSKDPALDKINSELLRAARTSANILIGQTWLQAGNVEGALSYLNRCLQEDPKNLSARLLRGQCEIAGKNWEKARQTYEDILNDDKGNAIAKTNLAWLLAEHLNQQATALKLVREELQSRYTGKPIDVERLTPDFLGTLGDIFAQAARKQVEKNLFDDMRSIFEKATRRYPADPRVHMHLGDAYAGLAQNDQATNAYQTVIRLLQSGKGAFSPEERKEFIEKTTQRLKGL